MTQSNQTKPTMIFHKGPFIKPCLGCGKQMEFRSNWFLSRQNYCSSTCYKKSYRCNDNYFNPPITPDKLITLGQIVATGYIWDYRTIRLYSDLETLTDIQRKIGSTHKIKKSDKGLWSLQFVSAQMVSDLVELGVSNSQYSGEVFSNDLWCGMKRTHCYRRHDDGHSVFRTENKKQAKWVEWRFSGQIVTQTFKDVYKGVLNIYYLVIFRE